MGACKPLIEWIQFFTDLFLVLYFLNEDVGKAQAIGIDIWGRGIRHNLLVDNRKSPEWSNDNGVKMMGGSISVSQEL